MQLQKKPVERYRQALEIQRNALVRLLHKVIDEEAGLEIAVHHARGKGLHGNAAGSANGHKLMPFAHVKTCLCGVDEGFADAEHEACHCHLIGHLGLLAHASLAAVHDLLAHNLQEGQHTIEAFLCSAHKDGEGSLAGAHVAACHRSVQGNDTLVGGLFCQLDGKGGARSGHVADDAALCHAGKNAFIAVCAHFLGACAEFCALVHESLCFGRSPVENAYAVASVNKVSCHGGAHDACSYPANARFVHCTSPLPQ